MTVLYLQIGQDQHLFYLTCMLSQCWPTVSWYVHWFIVIFYTTSMLIDRSCSIQSSHYRHRYITFFFIRQRITPKKPKTFLLLLYVINMYVFHLTFVKWFNVVPMLLNYFLKLKTFVHFYTHPTLGHHNKLKPTRCYM